MKDRCKHVIERVVCEGNEHWEIVSMSVIGSVTSHTYWLDFAGEKHTKDLFRRETLRFM